MKRYANAEKILPEELLKQVQTYHTRVLWVPCPGRFCKGRRRLILALHGQGVNTRQIAHLAGVTTRRVNQILAARGRETGSRHIETASGK